MIPSAIYRQVTMYQQGTLGLNKMYETKHRNLLLALTGKSRFPKLRFSN